MPQAIAGQSDAPTWSLPTRRYTGWVHRSQYVAMADGVKTATYLYLPQGLAEGEKIPAIVIPTPYFSMAAFRSPFFEKLAAKLAIGGQAEWAEEFARFGYATVLWDLRGSGASYGQKKCNWVPDILRDTPRLMDWIVQQPWCNGKVGGTGISARGMICEWMLAAGHPALKAIVPRFTAFDMYTSTHVGGLTASRFVRDVGTLLRSMDANRLADMAPSAIARGLLRLLGMQIMSMDEDPDGKLLAEAVRDHAHNEYIDRDMLVVHYPDEQLPSSATPATLNSQSPFAYARAMAESGGAIYSYTGWLDGPFPREMISLYNTVRTPGSKLLLGPWGHHAKFNSSPVALGTQPTALDQAAEIVRFFDYHLKGIDNGIGAEAPIRYYTMGTEQWQEAQSWPPRGEERRYYLAAGNALAERPAATEEADAYQVDFSAGTGVHSRFGMHLEGGRFPVRYPERATRDRQLLTYTSAPLQSDTEVTGHPAVTLYAASTATDGGFYAYLEDVYPGGRVVVATDGCLRARFRKLSPGQPPYWQGGPYRACTKADEAPLVPGEVAELTFDLFPVSYLFKAGHSIRLALAGADKDNFVTLPEGEAPELRFYRGGEHASFVSLPVVTRG
jgi:uncharacterized protein